MSTSQPLAISDLPPPTGADPVTFGGDTLDLTLEPGEALFVRRSSLILADGPMDLTTKLIAKRRFGIFSTFSGEVRWANRYEATCGPLTIVAGRDFHGTIAALRVTPDETCHIQPGLYLAHRGTLSFDTKRVAKKEFWTLTKVEGDGTVYLKVPGRPRLKDLPHDPMILDTNYVAAIAGAFTAHGKVFKRTELIKRGELENVRIAGEGVVLLQSENPGEISSGGGGGPFGLIGDLLPF
ncbi:MAG: AIM24 family protein [Pseudomonadota bacterium]